MSFNLKNKPSLLDPTAPHFWKVNVQDPDAVSEQLHELQTWFEGFEKRQRQNLADYEKALEAKKNWDKEFLACWKAISNYIKLEVLGKEA